MAKTYSYSSTAGRPSLDFMNTVDEWGDESRYGEGALPAGREILGDYGSFVTWAEQMGLLLVEQVAGLRKRAAEAGDENDRAWAHAVTARALLHAMFFAAASETNCAELIMGRFNRLAQKLPAPQLSSKQAGIFCYDWSAELCNLNLPLALVVLDARDLLLSPLRARIRMCAGPSCGWMFLDQSKNGRRRWCDMQDCGNRAKAKRFYERLKETSDHKGKNQ